MIRLKYMAGVVMTAIAISSCDEDTLTIGQSLTDQSDKLDMVTATFNVSTQTMVADSVLSLSNYCYFGKVKDPETNTDVTSEFSTQFHLLEEYYIPPKDSIASLDENGNIKADSCEIILYPSTPFKLKDSLTAMKLRVYELDRPIEEGDFYYSNFNPKSHDLIRTDNGAINKGKMFTYENLNDSLSVRNSSDYLASIHIPLNDPYTAKDGTVYGNYGTYILDQYFNHNSKFRNAYTFVHEVCPGFFFEVADGLGFHANISHTGLGIYYTVLNEKGNYKKSFVVAGTEEVLRTNCVTNDEHAIRQLANETTHTYLKSPAGLFTEVTLPVEEIKDYTDASGKNHKSDSLLAAKITFLRVNSLSSDDRMLGIPQSILMVEKDSIISFFEKNKLPDNKTSFYTPYSPTYNTYTFTNISNLITALWNQREAGLKSDSQWLEKHPNWNKVVLVPIKATASSSGSIVSVEHDMSLTSTKLVGGPANNHNPIAVSVVYAKFKDQ